MAPTGPLVVFAGKSVATAVIKEIVKKAFKYLDGYFSAETMEEMKNKLEDGMVQIQAVLEVVSPDHIEDRGQALDQWFWKLRDAVEGAEDAIDELEYYELEEKAKNHQISDWGSSVTKAKHKVITSVKHVPILNKSLKQFTHRGTLKRLKKAIERIDKAAAGAKNFWKVVERCQGQTSGRSGQEDFLNNDRQTGATSTVTKFIGREKEKQQILEWLTKETSVEQGAENVISPEHNLPIFSLVGHGGMGKTTLAQTICGHDEVKKEFKIIWVTVSTSFDATSVTRKMLESVNWETPRVDNLEPLQQALMDKLKSVNRFLLVLDDVWEEGKITEWEKLFAPLRTIKNRSKILLTTRMSSVAAMAANVMEIATEDLILEELPEDDNLELFNHHVFSGVNSPDYGELKVIGEQIAKKLGGCPLVTKVVGGHLRGTISQDRGNVSRDIWESFLHEDLDDFKGNSNDIMKVLRLSYYFLPTELQTCFRYCSIFPQDYKFTKEELVMVWIGSGLISTRENDAHTLQEIGESYLFHLTTKSFFYKEIVEATQGSDYSGEYYIMHDLMHELAVCVSFGECKRITSPGRIADVKDTVRHMHLDIDSIHGPDFDDCTIFVRFKNLRTLIASGGHERYISTLLENSRALRLIKMNGIISFNFPRKIGNLKHLRGAFVNELAPGSIHVIHKLYHLMVLEVQNYLQIDTEKLRKMGSLDRLQYLSYGRFGQFPVSGLVSLRVLYNYKVQGREGNKISHIGNLKYLQELEVQDLQNIDNSDEARDAKLKEKKYLKSLSLQWSASCSHTQNRIDDLVLDQLEPHANIRKLSIHGYKGLRLPFWMDNESLTIKKLVSLELDGCINWEELPCLGELVLLGHLTLNRLPKLQQIRRSSLVSSTSSMDSYLPPSLHSLRVKKCPELKEIPLLPTSLVYLELIEVGLTNLPRIGKVQSEDVDCQQSCLTLIVLRCSNLVSFNGSFLDQKQYLGGIRNLAIFNNWNLELVCLSFKEMTTLDTLCIEDCPNMRMLGGGGDMILTSSVKSLSIGLCGDLKIPLLASLQYTTNLSELRLDGSDLVSLPSADVWSNLKSLRCLKIDGCDNLVSLGGLGSLPSLSSLIIERCHKLVEAARSSLTSDASGSGGEEEHLVVVTQLDSLIIDFPSLLLVQPLKSLCHTRKLRIENWIIGIGDASRTEGLPERWLLQNCASLQSLRISSAEILPLSIRDLTSLQKLSLLDAEKLQSLPYLPLSLRNMFIRWCHSDLEKKIRGYGSPEHDKISHVPRAEIGEWWFVFGKECSKETYDELRGTDDNTLACWANQQDNGKGVESAPVQSALTRWRNLCRLGGAS